MGSYTSYSVLIEASGDDPTAVTDNAVHALLDELLPRGATVTGGEGSLAWSAQIFVDAADAAGAVIMALALVTRAAGNAGLPLWPVTRVSAVREDSLDDDHARPSRPDLVSAPEIAEILGVTAQRVHALAAANSSFPQPFYRLRTGRIWDLAAIEKFDAEWDRKPGRPRRGREGVL